MNVRLTAKQGEVGYVDEVHVLRVNGMSHDSEPSSLRLSSRGKVP
jgi:hypothetical protein